MNIALADNASVYSMNCPSEFAKNREAIPANHTLKHRKQSKSSDNPPWGLSLVAAQARILANIPSGPNSIKNI